jgi:hypothetical protein
VRDSPHQPSPPTQEEADWWNSAWRLSQRMRLSLIALPAVTLFPWILISYIDTTLIIVEGVSSTIIIVLSWQNASLFDAIGRSTWTAERPRLASRLRWIVAVAMIGGASIVLPAFAYGNPATATLGVMLALLAIEPLVDGNRLHRMGVIVEAHGLELDALHTDFRRRKVELVTNTSKGQRSGSLLLIGISVAIMFPAAWMMMEVPPAALGSVLISALIILAALLHESSTVSRAIWSTLMHTTTGVAVATTVTVLAATADRSTMSAKLQTLPLFASMEMTFVLYVTLMIREKRNTTQR